MSVAVRPPVRLDSIVPAAPVEDAAASAKAAESQTHRWFLILGVPFVVGASFFALAIGTGTEWPMAPAFLLGPLVMIAGYIYLSLSSDSNTES